MVSVKARRPTTTRPAASPASLLIGTLRDGVRDPAGSQRGPVGTAGVGLVPGQMAQPLSRPAPAAGPRDADLVNQRDQLASIAVLPRCQPGHQGAATPVADGVQLGGQPAA